MDDYLELDKRVSEEIMKEYKDVTLDVKCDCVKKEECINCLGTGHYEYTF